jgi:hypothetical protein
MAQSPDTLPRDESASGPHYRDIYNHQMQPVGELHNGWGVTSVDHAFVIFHRDKDTAVVKYSPVFPNHGIDSVLQGSIQMRQIQIPAESLAMKCLVKAKGE